ncbi:biotin--[acetyl-CoA-carboxylase] ligase [Proteocatella sphenisci]|uniref:biotin--[acetyl-CoA-carboxylase] ligase n=1 Tax=Proteocatella sphenisci TaxID=181070 RepID=UPI0004919D6E|nr:biotin--[acetyl-CoA-carboxylase] ligase [Proteocatella sphenisci]
MKNKEKVLQILYQKNGECVSSSEIIAELGITRSAIFKIISELKKQGFDIESIHHKGYRLSDTNDIISPEIINSIIKKYGKNKKIQYLESVDSTNTFAKKALMDNAFCPEIIIANTQNNGRGRMGRSFYSPENTGIYCSFILDPFIKIENSILVTVAASVAVSKAIEKVTQKDTQIKWINDIYIDHRKVCGILTEAVTDFETGMIGKIILGIGINFSTPYSLFPKEISETATSIFADDNSGITRNHLIAQLIIEIDECMNNIENEEIIKYYRKKSMVLGKTLEISYFGKEAPIYGKAVDIDSNGFLIIETNNGLLTLNSGEVSIRQNEEE